MSRPDRPRSRAPRALAGWWQAAFIFAPLLVLAALGAWGIRAGRLAAKKDAVRAAETTVRAVVEFAAVEFVRLRAETIPMREHYPAELRPVAPGEAFALYEQALAGPPEEAEALLAQLERDHADAFTPSGLPLLPLVAWSRLRALPDEGATFERLCRAAVSTHPSLLTPELLDRAETLLRARGAATDSAQKWRALWREHESARAAPEWWREPAEPGFVRAYSTERLGPVALKIAGSARGLLPDYLALDVRAGAASLLPAPPAGEELLRTSAAGPLSLGWLLAAPERLYARERQQTLWLGALLACALAAASAGFFTLRRALARERMLGEMKSNFVSSVSHELRAPIASMRLLAENLETGAVPDPARRAEYHGLIANECRRLSALIENVLDFARIEQGRKVYRFAETDLAALVHDSIQLLAPRATQRRQMLHAQLEPLTRPPLCDGQAIQQALLNLLDNALKFSREGSVVTVRVGPNDAQTLELNRNDAVGEVRGRRKSGFQPEKSSGLPARCPAHDLVRPLQPGRLFDGSGWKPDLRPQPTPATASFRLSVTDEGPGIPVAERARIFERFYRIGSELTRETQGAGIGLSIVQHIAEGHGGRVEVRSELGKGATFALVLPLSPRADS